MNKMHEFITINNIFKSYSSNINRNQKIEVINGFSLRIKKGSFITFFGPNGCGKTTLLNIVAGLTFLDKGNIEIDGKAPEEAKTGYIFQNYNDSLFPWKKAIDNIAYPLEINGVGKHERREKAKSIVKQFGVEIPLDNYPYQLSGGQKQLVAIARALIYEPDVLLMDEPFGALDYQTRYLLQDIIQVIWGKFNVTILFVSHEIDEALYLADKMILLKKRPTSIVEIIENEMPRPRSHEKTNLPDFIALRKKAISIFQQVVS